MLSYWVRWDICCPGVSFPFITQKRFLLCLPFVLEIFDQNFHKFAHGYAVLLRNFAENIHVLLVPPYCQLFLIRVTLIRHYLAFSVTPVIGGCPPVVNTRVHIYPSCKLNLVFFTAT